MSITPNTVAYPSNLTPAFWDKNKGTVAKMAGETGIGAALAKLQATHARIDWNLLTAYGYGKLHDLGEIADAEKKAKAYYQSKVVPYAAQAGEVMALALATAKKFQANKLIPKSSTATVAAIAKAADVVKVACKSLDVEFKTFAEYREKLVAQIEGQKKLIRPNIDKLEKGLAACIKNPTKDSWNDHCTQQCRSINNGVQVNPEWKAVYGKTWVKYDGVTFFGKLKDEAKLDEKAKKKQAADIVAMCKEIQGELAKLKSGLK